MSYKKKSYKSEGAQPGLCKGCDGPMEKTHVYVSSQGAKVGVFLNLSEENTHTKNAIYPVAKKEKKKKNKENHN